MAKIYAHRGASGTFPENTMLAFREAAALGADGIEIDVQMTKDGVVVICHDETVDRTTNGTGFIKDLCYHELLRFDAGQGQTIPTLDDFLTFCAENNLEANIELKNSIIRYPGLEQAVEVLLRKHAMAEKTILSSFNHKSMALVKDLFPYMKTGLLVANPLYHAEKYMLSCKADALHPHFASIDASDIVACHQNGIAVHVWTVNEEKEWQAVANLAVDIIITNFPDRRMKKPCNA